MTGGTETERRMVTSETNWTRTGGITDFGAETGAEIGVIITETGAGTGVGTGVSGGGAGAEIVIATITKDTKTVGNLSGTCQMHKAPGKSPKVEPSPAHGEVKTPGKPSTKPTKGEPTKPNKGKDEDCELMETSDLRDRTLDPVDVSIINLSAAIEVREHDQVDVDIATTEEELARMGETPTCALSNVCSEMEALLGEGPSSTSTPNVTLLMSSMPSLVSGSSISGQTDSGHDSGQPHVSDLNTSPGSSPVFSPIPSRVIGNSEIGNLIYFMSLMSTHYRQTSISSEEGRLQASEAQDLATTDHDLKNNELLSILTILINLSLYLFRHLNHVHSMFPSALKPADNCYYNNFASGK